MSVTIKFRRDSSTQWTSKNPILSQGEPGFEINTGQIKIGDGVSNWNSLSYLSGSEGTPIVLENIDDRVAELLVAGTGINLDYNDEDNTLTINSNSNANTGDISFSGIQIIGTGTIELVPSSGLYNNDQYWRFNSNGKLTLPNGNLIESQAGQGETNIQIIDNESPFKIYTHANSNAKAWIYDAGGNLSIPGSISLPNNSTIASGTYDNGTSGNGGISLNCVVGYELNWQGGRLKNTYNNGTYPIYVDSPMSFVPVVVSGISPDSGSIETNASLGDMFDITLTENITLANPTNPINGKTLRWRITQDGTGNRTLTLGNKFNIPSSASSTLPWSTGVNSMDILAATYHSGRDKWDVVAFVPGY